MHLWAVWRRVMSLCSVFDGKFAAVFSGISYVFQDKLLYSLGVVRAHIFSGEKMAYTGGYRQVCAGSCR